VKGVRRSFKFDISGLLTWLVSQGHVPASMPANWDLVWPDPDGENPPEVLTKRFSAAMHIASPGHGWIMERADPASPNCKTCGISTAIWLCHMAVVEAEKDQTYVTNFSTSLGKVLGLVDQARNLYSKACAEYSEEHVRRWREFLENAKMAAAAPSKRPKEQVEYVVRYLEKLLESPDLGTTVRLMVNLDIDSKFDQLSKILIVVQDDVLVDTRNPGYAQPGVVKKGRPPSLRTRVEQCLRAVGFTAAEIGEQLIRSLDDPLTAEPDSSAEDGRDRGGLVRDRTRSRSRPRNS